jgi:hypothetical protein
MVRGQGKSEAAGQVHGRVSLRKSAFEELRHLRLQDNQI